jgi:hypothetical protein
LQVPITVSAGIFEFADFAFTPGLATQIIVNATANAEIGFLKLFISNSWTTQAQERKYVFPPRTKPKQLPRPTQFLTKQTSRCTDHVSEFHCPSTGRFLMQLPRQNHPPGTKRGELVQWMSQKLAVNL